MKSKLVYIVYIIASLIMTQTDSLVTADCSPKQMPELTASIPLESSPMVSAVLLECPKQFRDKSTSNDSPEQKSNKRECEDQLMVNIRVNPSFHIEKIEKFLILDEVYDPRRRTKAKIMSPYLIEISRGEPVMMYPLEFSKSVKCENCEAQNMKKEPKKNNLNPSSGCNSHNENKIKPQDDSMARIVNKLAEVFAPATKIGSTTGNEGTPSCSKTNKNEATDIPNQPLESKSPERYQQRNIPTSSDSNGIDDTNFATGPRKCSSGTNGQQEEQAVVGIDDKLLKQLQTRKMAQLGLVKTKRNRGNNKRGIFSSVGNEYISDADKMDDLLAASDQERNSEKYDVYNDNKYEDNAEELSTFSKNDNEENDEKASTHDDVEMYETPEFNMDTSDPKSVLRTPRRRFHFYKKRKHGPNIKVSFAKNAKQFGDSSYSNTMPMSNSMIMDKLNNDLENCQCDLGRESQAQDPEEDQDINNDYNEDAILLDNNEFKSKNPQRNYFKIDANKQGNFLAGNERFLFTNNNNQLRSSAPTGHLKENSKLTHFLSEIADPKRKNNREIEGITKLWVQRNHDDSDSNVNTEAREYSDRNSDIDNSEDGNEAELRNMLYNLKRYYQRTHPAGNVGIKQAKHHPYSDNKEMNSFSRKGNYPSDFKFPSNRKFKPQLFNKYHNEGARWKGDTNPPNNRNHMGGSSSKIVNDLPIEKNNQVDDDDDDGRMPEQVFNFDDDYDAKTISSQQKAIDEADEKLKLNYQKALLDFENSKNEGAQKSLANYFDSNSHLYNTAGYTIIPSALNGGIDVSKSSKQLGWITDPELDAVDPLEALEAVYTEKPPQHLANNRKYYSGVLQSPRSAARELIYREPAQYLPKTLPFEDVIDDPYLSVSDKLRVLEAVDPPNEKSERKLYQLTQEVDKAYLARPTAFPFPIPLSGGGGCGSAASSASSTNNKLAEGSKRKRSFLLYDDLEMRETVDDMDNDFAMENPQQEVSLRAQEDTESCSSCGGKNKKPPKTEPSIETSYSLPMYEDVQTCSSCGKNKKPPKTEPTLQIPETMCNCKSEQSPTCECSADETTSDKGVRSISDAWYAVFNMSAPLPFLTTRMRIFRKRHNVWWKIAPSITLNSLSGIFANANLSVLFSSHVDIFQLEKALRLQNHQLIIPKDNTPQISIPKTTANSSKSIGKKSRTLSDGDLHNVVNIDELSKDPSKYLLVKRSDELCNQLEEFRQYELNDKEQGAQKRGINNQHDGIRTIGDLGYFPASMNLLEQCPNDKEHLCLNMLADKSPAFSLKVKLPFRENALVNRNISRVKIASIITDATTKDVLQVSVQVINEGMEPKEFSIIIANCPTSCASAAKTSVERVLAPRLGETINFLLPFIVENNHKKITCDVIVKTTSKAKKFPEPSKKPSKCHTPAQRRRATQQNRGDETKAHIVATRKLLAETDNRCFCIWECKCHCVQNIETHVDFNVCQNMPIEEKRKAGLLMHCQPGSGDRCSMDEGADEDNIDVEMPATPIPSRTIERGESGFAGIRASLNFFDFLHNALMMIIIMLLLGLLKAIIGRFCSKKIDKCGFSYVQLGRSYGNSSKRRRFLVNIFFFIVFPFVFWCKCFTPSQEDLLVASTEWQCSYNNSNSKNSDRSNTSHERVQDSEEEIFLPPSPGQKSSKGSQKKRCRLRGGEDIDYDNMDELQLAFDEGIFDDDDEDDDEEVNTKFILQALVESRESLKKLLREHSSQQINITPILDDEENTKLKVADELVQALKSSQIVYRTFDQPMEGIRNIPPGVRYCIQGYFLPSLGKEYEFVNYTPLAQYRSMAANGTSIEILRPPVILCPKLFSRNYADKIDVLEANDLTVHPPPDAPCINISTMASVASSVVKLIANQSHNQIPSMNDSPEETPLALRERILAATHARELEHLQRYQYQLPLQPEDALLPPETSSSPHTSPTATGGNYDFDIDIDDNQLDDESEPLIDDMSQDNYNPYQWNTIPE